MIYDRLVSIHNVTGGAVLGRKLDPAGDAYYCAKRTVGLTRYYTALQIGDRTDAVLELPGRYEIRSTQIAVMDGEQFRILQVQHEAGGSGLPVTVLSLSRLEELYEFERAEAAP